MKPDVKGRARRVSLCFERVRRQPKRHRVLQLKFLRELSSPDNRGDRFAAKRAVVEGRVAAFRFESFGVDRPCLFRVEDGQVGVCAGTKRAAPFQIEDARGIDGAEFDESVEVNNALMNETVTG